MMKEMATQKVVCYECEILEDVSDNPGWDF